MYKELIPSAGSFYKANLHCHTTVSDGLWTPEQVRAEYMKKGYSVVAFTDHDVLIPHDDLKCEGFLPLHGFEMEIDEDGTPRTCHICFIALDPENLTQPFWHRSRYLFGHAPEYRDQVRFDPAEPDYVRTYDPETISALMQKARDLGFFVTYNHPTWSLEDYSSYSRYRGMHAMEMVNYGCLICGYDEYNSRVYDDMLRGGQRIYCIDTDDNHNAVDDSFGGFTMIKAPSLSYTDITRALEQGHFYASQAPEIHSLTWESGRVHITCSPAARIHLITDSRNADIALPAPGETLTEAVFTPSSRCTWFRLTVVDQQGNKADTNAYFMDELRE